LNRSRSYLIDVAQRHGVSVFRDITSGVQHIVDRVAKRDTISSARAIRLPGGSAPSSPVPGAKFPAPSASSLTNSNGTNSSNNLLRLSPPAVRSHTVPLQHETFSDQVEAFVTSDEFMDKCRYFSDLCTVSCATCHDCVFV
jgi:hypothetical protein